MKSLTKGQYLGVNHKQTQVCGICISETHFREGYSSDWHFHENPYLTLIVEGGSIELRRNKRISCIPGSVIVYDFDDAHRNMDYKKNSRTLSLEFDRSWLSENGFSSKHFNWNGMVTDPEMKFILIKILNEQRFDDEVCTLSMQTMALKLVTMLTTAERDVDYMLPWVAKIKDLLNDQWNEVPSLEYLSRQLSIHPVTISRYFPKFFGCTMGDYLRRIKVDKSLYLLKQAKMCNWEIALECGFSDSNHFNRVFKTYTGISPTEFRGI